MMLTESSRVVDLFGHIPEQVVQSDDSKNVLGRVAEFLACAAICEMGYRAIHAPGAGYDVLVDDLEGIWRLQVKAASKSDQRVYRGSAQVEKSAHVDGNLRRRFRRAATQDDCDVIALVAMDLRRVVFLPVSEITQAGGFSVPVSDFRVPNIERLTWLRSVESLRALLPRN